MSDIRLLGQYRTKQTAESPIVRRLLNALILSDQAKRYVMAHELSLLRSSYLPVKSANVFLFTGASFWIVRVMNGLLQSKSKEFRKSLLNRSLAGIVWIVAVAVVGVTVDLLDHVYDIRALKRALRSGDFEQGATEFYQKSIERNRALYELLGHYGPTYYRQNGDIPKLLGLWSVSYRTHLAVIDNWNHQQHH